MHCCNINKSRRGDFFGSPGICGQSGKHRLQTWYNDPDERDCLLPFHYTKAQYHSFIIVDKLCRHTSLCRLECYSAEQQFRYIIVCIFVYFMFYFLGNFMCNLGLLILLLACVHIVIGLLAFTLLLNK